MNPVARTQHEPLSEVVSHLLEECRMVLPGIQALFGFQLMAVFNQVFWERLEASGRFCHFAAIALVAISVVLVMTPAAYHRQAEPEAISRNFVILSTRVLFWSMFPLMMAIVIEFFVISHLIFASTLVALSSAAVLGLIFVWFWFALPRRADLQRLVRKARV
jgi:hypothetical protein